MKIIDLLTQDSLALSFEVFPSKTETGFESMKRATVPAMEETIKQLFRQAPWCKIVVGGAVLNQEYADAIGADKYAKAAMETVRYAEEIHHSLKGETV